VLELGADGTFETSTSPVKQAPAVNIDYSSFPVDSEDAKEELLDSITAGQFRVYRQNSEIFIIIRLIDGESVDRVGYEAPNVYFRTSAPKRYNVPLTKLNQDVDSSNGSCTTMGSYVTIRFPLLGRQ